MPAKISAVELAVRLGVEPTKLRAWLRRQSLRGHPLLGRHLHGASWTFTTDEAALLAAEYEGSAAGAVSETVDAVRGEAPARSPGAPVLTAMEAATHNAEGHRVKLEWRGATVTTLADLLRPGLRAVTIGINPAPVSVAAGHYYQGRAGKTFYRRLDMVGLLPKGPGFEDDRAFAAGVGFTDVVKRPTRSAAEVTREELAYGRQLLEARLTSVDAPLLIFVFKQAATTLLGGFNGHGLLPATRSLVGARVFVMPGPYEQKALVHRALAELKQHLSTRSTR